jgi:predicted metalloenzyme YecM
MTHPHRGMTGSPQRTLLGRSGRLASGGPMCPPTAPSYDGGREGAAMADPVGDIIGDYRAFAAQQQDRLLARGIDIRPYALSHLAVRVPEWDQYVHVRNLLERHAVANRENVWNGRPISLIAPAEPLEVLDGKVVPLIELIPPVHQRVYKMGLEHLGVVVGDEVEAFSRQHRAALTGQQFQSADNEPYYVLFEASPKSSSTVAPCMTSSSSNTAPRSTTSSTSTTGTRSAS